MIIDIRPVNNLVLVGRDQPGVEDMLDQIRSDQIRSDQFLPFKRVSDPGEGDGGLGQAPETRVVERADFKQSRDDPVKLWPVT